MKSQQRSCTVALGSLLESIPSAVLSLSVGVLNVGVVWLLASDPAYGLYLRSQAAVTSEDRLLDACATICVLLQLGYACKCVYLLARATLHPRILWQEYLDNIIQWAAGKT